MRILIVEDDDSSLDLAKRVVERMGHTVLTARDGVEGLASIRREGPDLLVLDIHLPGIAGFVVLREIRRDERLRDMPVIAVSAGSSDDRREALALGSSEFVCKPYRPEDLRAAIDRHLPADRVR